MNASFTLDGGTPTAFIYSWDTRCLGDQGSPTGCYNTSVYNAQSLNYGTHMLNITMLLYAGNTFTGETYDDFFLTMQSYPLRHPPLRFPLLLGMPCPMVTVCFASSLCQRVADLTQQAISCSDHRSCWRYCHCRQQHSLFSTVNKEVANANGLSQKLIQNLKNLHFNQLHSLQTHPPSKTHHTTGHQPAFYPKTPICRTMTCHRLASHRNLACHFPLTCQPH